MGFSSMQRIKDYSMTMSPWKTGAELLIRPETPSPTLLPPSLLTTPPQVGRDSHIKSFKVRSCVIPQCQKSGLTLRSSPPVPT